MAEATAKKQKGPNKFSKFFKEVSSELKKVAWPSKKQVIKNTLIVIAAVIIIGIFIWALDLLFSYGLDTFIKR